MAGGASLSSSLHLKLGRRRSSTIVSVASPADTQTSTRVQLPHKTRNSRVLVLGGTGRIGGSTAIALSNLCPDLQIIVAGRNREKGANMLTTLGGNSEFCEVDINNEKSLEAALEDADLVVHAAGPFQQAEKCTVLEAALKTKTAYIDVCDDTAYAFRAKSFHDRAVAANVPAITTGGICPGVSNVMAAELVRLARNENKGKPERLRFFYYTEGTGGAGPTVLATSFLLLGEEVVAFNKGEKIKLRPYSGMLKIDFGKGIGKKDVYLFDLLTQYEVLASITKGLCSCTCTEHDLNSLPEVRSTHEILGVPTVSARFGSAPFFWNWAMEAMTALLPAELLRDRSKVQQMVKMFDPVVRAVDEIAGARVSMRVDLDCSGGRNTVSVLSHKKLSVSVGTATTAFVLAVLEGSTKPGVWFPEEAGGIAIEAREVLLKRAAQGTINFVTNKPAWMVETNPKELGLGIYV